MQPQPTRLLNRNFLLLWQGQMVSQLGNQAFSIAMVFWVKQATESASLMGLMWMASGLPAVLLAPIGGAFADRANRIRIAVTCDGLAGLTVLGMALAMTSGLPQKSLLVLLFAAAILLGSLLAFLTPALSAAIPDIVPKEKLPAANALNQLAVQVSVFAGQALGGVLFRVLGAPLLFLFDGLSFLGAATVESFARAPVPPVREKLDWGATFREFGRELAEGFAYARKAPGLLGFVLAAAGFNFFSMPLLVLLPFFVTDVLHATADWYGYLMASISVGAVTGFLTVSTLPLVGRTRSRFIITLMLIAPFCLGALALLHSPGPALVVAFLLGLVTGGIGIYVMTTVQATTPSELRGRLMGLLTALLGGLSPLGMMLGGFIGDLTGKNVPLIAGACALLSFIVTLIAVGQRSTRDFLAYD